MPWTLWATVTEAFHLRRLAPKRISSNSWAERLRNRGLESVYLAGMSFGGWLGIKYALAEAGRVRKLEFISPAASLQPLAKQFMPRTMLTMLPPRRYWFGKLMGWMGVRGRTDSEFSQQLLDLMWLGAEHINMSAETMRVMPTVISDTHLRALSMPVLPLIGETRSSMIRQKLWLGHNN